MRTRGGSARCAGVYRDGAVLLCGGATLVQYGSPMSETQLDLSGLKCPLPALKTRKALQGLKAGDQLVVTCTDPLAAIDIPNLLRETGDALEEQSATERALVFRIRKAERV